MSKRKIKTLANKVYAEKHRQTRKELNDLKLQHEGLQLQHDALKVEHGVAKQKLTLAEAREKKRKDAKAKKKK